MTITPVHLSGARCGGRVLLLGEEIGTIHCWAEGGACVRLNEEYLRKLGHLTWNHILFPLPTSAMNGPFIARVTHIFISNEQFADPEVTVVSF